MLFFELWVTKNSMLLLKSLLIHLVMKIHQTNVIGDSSEQSVHIQYKRFLVQTLAKEAFYLTWLYRGGDFEI